MTFKKFLGEQSVGFHDFRYVLRKNSWVFLIGLTIFLLLIPFSTAGLPGSSIFNIEVTHEQMKFRLFHPQVIPVILAALAAMGMMTGAALFRFVLDKKETTIFFSLGITRGRLFVNRLTAGLLALFFMLLLPMLLSYGLNLRALGDYTGLFSSMVYLTVGMFLAAAVSFLVTVLSIFAAGTLSEALVYWGGILLLPTVLCYSVNLLLKQLYWGNPWGMPVYSGGTEIRPSLIALGARWNPILFLRKGLETHGQFVRPLDSAVPEPVSWSLLLGWALAGILLAVACCGLLRRRKAELAGLTAVNPVLSEWVILLCSLFGFSEVFSLLHSHDGRLAVGFSVAGFLAVHLFWRRTAFRDAFTWRKSLRSLALQGAVIGLVCLGCTSGMTAASTRFLAGGDAVEAHVTYTGAPGLVYEEASGSSTGRGYYLMSELSISSAEGLETVKALHSRILRSGKQTPGPGNTPEDTVIPYDVCFSYLDADGVEHTWYYDCCSFAQLEAMLALEELDEVRAGQTALFSGNPETAGESLAGKAYTYHDIYLTDPYLCDTFQLELNEDQRAALLQALARDTAEMDLQQRYFPDDPARAVLMFTDNGEQDCKYYTYHLNNEYLYLTSAYSHTLAWLEDNGLLSLISGVPEVEYVILQRFDPYIGINAPRYPMGLYFMAYCADTANEFLVQKDFGKQYTITDPAEVQTLMGVLQPGCYMSRGGFLAAVKPQGDERLHYLFLPEAKIPAFVAG